MFLNGTEISLKNYVKQPASLSFSGKPLQHAPAHFVNLAKCLREAGVTARNAPQLLRLIKDLLDKAFVFDESIAEHNFQKSSTLSRSNDAQAGFSPRHRACN